MTATASLGVIHRGHEKEALTLMQAYLPKESNSPGYAESGSLYALGLIHANHGANIIEYLLSQTKDATSDVSIPTARLPGGGGVVVVVVVVTIMVLSLILSCSHSLYLSVFG